MFICTLQCLHYGVNMNFASDKASFCKIQTLQVKQFTLKVLGELLFINSVLPDIVVHDSYTVGRHFEKSHI